HGTAGAVGARLSLRPLPRRGTTRLQSPGENLSRERDRMLPPSLRAKRTNPLLRLRRYGLLRRGACHRAAPCADPLAPDGAVRSTGSAEITSPLLHPAPFRDEQRGRLRRLPQRVQVDIFVEAVHGLAAGAEAQARDVVVEPVEASICQRGEDEILHGAAVDG